LFQNNQRPGRVGSPGQKPSCRVGSYWVKNPDASPSRMHWQAVTFAHPPWKRYRHW